MFPFTHLQIDLALVQGANRFPALGVFLHVELPEGHEVVVEEGRLLGVGDHRVEQLPPVVAYQVFQA